MASSSSSNIITRDTFDEINSSIQASAMKTLRAAGTTLPADLDFHRTLDSEYGAEVDATAARVLALTNKLLALAESSNTSSRGKGKARLQDKEDVLDRFHAVVVDAMDGMLERADTAIDLFLGKNKAPAIAVNPPTVTSRVLPRVPPKGRLDPTLQHAAHLRKPQLDFKNKPNNYAEGPWRSDMKHKYNAQVPLGYIIDAEDEAGPQDLTHPYRFEITSLQYPSHMFESTSPISPDSFDNTPFEWVSTPEALAGMLEDLRHVQEIAIDLEHHDYRTYGGFVCLMQVSTRNKDWIVDTLVLRDELEDLNEVFTDPKIVKVLHGAESDVVWLQRDFNLYLVNLFDTFHASKVLDFPRHGLAQLLEMYCDVIPDKRYQTADWRLRPLPAEMLKYARMDTHYLLFIYDQLRNALLDRAKSPSSEGLDVSPMREVLSRSAITAKRTHTREPYDPAGGGVGGWDVMAKKWNKTNLLASAVHAPGSVGNMQRAVFQAIHAWRDRTARQEDESTRFVLPNHYMFQIAEQPPADMAALMSVFHPVPHVIRVRAKEFLDTIRGAVKQALGPAPSEDAPAQHGATSPHSEDVLSDAMDLNEEDPPAAAEATETKTAMPPSVNTASSARFLAPTSTLLGDVLGTQRHGPRHAKPAFENVLAKINSSLSIVPSAPMPITSPIIEATHAEAAPESSSGPNVDENGQIEIPFVPAAQRKPAAELEMEGEIVVVGQRQKKRKRDRKAKVQTEDDTLPASTAPSPPALPSPQAELEPFDYASAPNVLDEGAEFLDDGSGKKGKKRKLGKREARGAVFQYGDFPAPPRNPTDIRSGNKSYTYR